MKKYLHFFISIFIILLIMRIPANLVMPLFVDIKSLKIQNITGTIWSGQMQSSLFNKFSWDFNLSTLFLGKLEADTKIKINAKNQITTDLSINIIGEITAKNIKGHLTIAYLSTHLKNIPSIIKGNIKFIKTDIVLNENFNFPKSINGIVIIKKLDVLNIKLGDFQSQWATKNQTISALVTNKQNAKLETKLHILIDNEKKLKVKGSLNAKNQETKNILKSFRIPKNINLSIPLN
jgi:hypothetical protein